MLTILFHNAMFLTKCGRCAWPAAHVRHLYDAVRVSHDLAGGAPWDELATFIPSPQLWAFRLPSLNGPKPVIVAYRSA
jgi:hypothetical protein